MQITCVALQPDGGMRPEPEAPALDRWRNGGGPYWVHLAGSRPEEVQSWLATLGVPPEILEQFEIGSEETRILPLPGEVLVAYPVPAGDGRWAPEHFVLLCLERLVVTVQPPGDSILDGAPSPGLRLREGSTAAVVCALISLHAARLRRLVVALRREGDVLADRMDQDPWSVSVPEILAAKRKVLVLAGTVDEELAVLEALRASQLLALPLGRLADGLQIAGQILQATDRDLERLDRRLSGLQDRHGAAAQERTNHRLGVLTMVSAIFMPLTLMAGIYGMNFEVMPELHLRYAYPVVLCVMAILAGGLYWYFRTRWRAG